MIISIDHIVLTTQNIEKTVFFYRDILGMELDEFVPPDGSAMRKSLKFGSQKINLHQEGLPFKPHAKNPVSGAIDICFLSSTKIDEWQIIFSRHNVLIEKGPIKKTGATGLIMSIYVRDPDQNLIEISNKI